MADRYDYYFNQLLAESELDGGFDALEQADWDIVGDLGLLGLVSGGGVSQHSPTPDLTVDVAALKAYDPNGKRIRVSTGQTVDMSIDYLGASTSVAGVGNSKILTLMIGFDRTLSDPRIDGDSATVYFSRAESYTFKVIQGAEATTGTEVAPSKDSSYVFLADITIDYAQTQILTADIDADTRSGKCFELSAGALAVSVGTPEESDQAILTELNNHITDVANAHDASAVAFGSAPYAGTGLNIAATELDAVIKEIADEAGGLDTANTWNGTNDFNDSVTVEGNVTVNAGFSLTILNGGDLSVGTGGAYTTVTSTATTLKKAVVATNIVSPATMGVTEDNYAPTGYNTAFALRLTPNGTGTVLSGIVAQAGHILVLANLGSVPLTLEHDATSTAANRFLCPNAVDYAMPAGSSCLVWYDSTSARWRVMGPVI
jgi:hypothetical protein